MSSVPRSSSSGLPALASQPLVAGALAGLAGGVVFGLMMAVMMPPMLGMIGALVGAPSLGFLVHGIFSMVIGAGFALVLSPRVRDTAASVLYGAGYGLAWWVLGPLLIMPIWMGMGPMLSEALARPNIMSLIGHVIYGVITGVVYRLLTR
jgi:hypothetical protein